jgi:predicted ATPase
MRRWIVTGAPGAGKTMLVDTLAARGHAVVREAATDVAATHPADDAHWERPEFLDDIVTLQRARELAPVPLDISDQVFDRSPICTLALARHLDRDMTPLLADELARIERERTYERRVFYVEWLGFLTPTSVRRIDVEQTRDFDRTHRHTYTELGYELVDVPVATVAKRADLVESVLVGARGSISTLHD